MGTWRYGDTNPVKLPFGGEIDVEVGDLIYVFDHRAFPACCFPVAGVPEKVQAAFHRQFAGVALEARKLGVPSELRIATAGVFEFSLRPEHPLIHVGVRLGIDALPACRDLPNDFVAAVPIHEPERALGRCVRQTAKGEKKILMAIRSTLMSDGPQQIL